MQDFLFEVLMRYQDLKVYAGAKTACDRCSRAFARGQIIHVDERHDLAFCESGEDTGDLCLMDYTLFTFAEQHPGQALFGMPMVFGAHADRPVRPAFIRRYRLFGR